MHKAILLLLAWYLAGCSLIIKPASNRLANNLSSAILNQNDPETVADALPAYLLLVDSLIAGEPEQVNLILTGAKLNGAYASMFVEDPLRRQRLTEKAKAYSERAFCLTFSDDCLIYQQPFSEYQQFLSSTEEGDIAVLYTFATAWANWIQAHSNDWEAKADLPKVQATLEQVLVLDENYQNGEPQVYLGVLSSLLPPALGGKPEQAKAYFERGIVLSDNRNLLFKVIYAERYARLVFDRDLHDQLLQSVLEANPEAPGLTLINTLAQKQAQQLLDSAEDYF